MKLDDWLKETKAKLEKISEFPGLEAHVITSEILNQTKAWIISHPEYTLLPEENAHLNELCERLLNGEPLPYVIGHWEFFGLKFWVTPAVLIPRPETELLVEHALNWLSQRKDAEYIADVGTGSGCIAISLAKHHQGVQIAACDRSWEALQVAKTNINNHHLESRITLIQANLLEPFGNGFDLICANLPYIPTIKLKGLSVTKHEPVSALDGGQDGLFWIKRLLEMSRHIIRPKGQILLEIEAEQGNQAVNFIRETLPTSAETVLHKDLAGKDRLISVQF